MLHFTVLAASGGTGLELTRQALTRGHSVTAICRHPDRIRLEPHPHLHLLAADVSDNDAIAGALHGSSIVLSGLGTARGDQTGVLTAGAGAALAANPDRVIWLGAFGTGASAQTSGLLARTMLKAFLRSELTDKVTADTSILHAGGTVFHAGPLTDNPLSPTRRTVPVSDAPRGLFRARIGRATVAAAMLDEAENTQPISGTLIPLER